MSNDDRSAHSVATGIGGVVLAVILVNVLLRVAPLPDIDLPSISVPDLPAWLDTAVEVVHTAVKVKNWLLAAVVVVVVVGVAVDLRSRQRAGDEE